MFAPITSFIAIKTALTKLLENTMGENSKLDNVRPMKNSHFAPCLLD